jgi:hypothetical protein
VHLINISQICVWILNVIWLGNEPSGWD